MSELNPSSLIQQIESFKGKSLPPVHLWNPPLCKNIKMKIDREGRWHFMDSYYLVTPVEKNKLEVEIKPFLIVDFSIAGRNKKQVISFSTNTGDQFILDNKHPLRVEQSDSTKECLTYVLVRSNLEGFLSRNVYYNLVNISKEQIINNKSFIGLWSRGLFFKLGEA